MTMRALAHLAWLWFRTWVAIIISRFWRYFIIFPKAPHPGDTGISATWITRILRNAQLIDNSTRVTSSEPVGLSGNRGLAGAMTRVNLKYSHPTKAPSTLVLKMTQDGYNQRKNSIAGNRHREALIYSSAFASHPSVHSLLPRVYYSYASALRGECVLLMEDLKDRPFWYDSHSVYFASSLNIAQCGREYDHGQSDLGCAPRCSCTSS